MPTPAPEVTPPAEEDPLVRGVALSPRSYDRFFAEASEVGTLILWGGSASELADRSSAAHVVAQLAAQHGLAFAAQVGYHDVDLDEAAPHLVAYVEEHEPAYMVLGVEVDRIWEEDPAWVDAFAAWYAEAYDAVKAASADTLVFPSFQLERMAGLTGGLYGGPASSPPTWDLLDKFPKRDLTAFTTYPGLPRARLQDTSQIPADHYAEAAPAGSPVGFTEVGHFARLDQDAPEWESSDEEQRGFVERFLADAAAIDARLAVWLHLHDQTSITPPPFQHMGLIDGDGAHRPAYEAWRSG